MGFNDAELIEELPVNIKTDIRCAMYAKIIQQG